MERESAFFALVHPDDFNVVRETINEQEPEVIVNKLRLLVSPEAAEAFKRWKYPEFSADGFLQELPYSRRALAVKFLAREEFGSLGILINVCSPRAQDAYEKWMRLPGHLRMAPSEAILERSPGFNGPGLEVTPRSANFQGISEISPRGSHDGVVHNDSSSTDDEKSHHEQNSLTDQLSVSSINCQSDSSIIDPSPLRPHCPVYSGNEVPVEKQIDQPEPETTIPADLPQRTTILLLGETGVGKSTFINGLVNLWVYRSLAEARAEGPVVLVDTKFIVTDANYGTHDVVAMAPHTSPSSANEVLSAGQSCTQEPKAHTFKYHQNGQAKFITIVDTPGMGDVRGLDQDGTNMTKILSFISQFDQLHAICILLKPNEARMTVTFRYCVDELFRHLHRSASTNILFCFTHGRETNYRPGNSLPTLKQHLKELSEERNIQISVNRESIYCVDNEPFRHLCASLHNPDDFNASQSFANSNESWVKNVTEANRLLTRISELPAHDIRETLSINNVRQAILRLARPLAEINRNLIQNIQEWELKKSLIEQLQKEGQDLRGLLHVYTSVIFLGEVKMPQTVCTTECCVEYRRIGTDQNSPVEKVFKTVCHEDCQLERVEEGGVPNPILKYCLALRENIEHCKKCGCSWDTHMHIRYRIKEKRMKLINDDVKQQMKDKKASVLNGERFLKNLKRMINQIKGEHTKLTKISAEFAAYLNDNSILPYNDSYADYLDYLINEEHAKSQFTLDNRLVQQMTEHLLEYGSAVDVLKKSLKDATTTRKGVEEINAMLENLKEVDRFKDLLADINAYIEPALLYAAETWVFRSKDLNKLVVAQRRMMRRMMGVTIAVAIDFSNHLGTNGITLAVADISSIFNPVTISQKIGQVSRIGIANYTYVGETVYGLNYFRSTSQFTNEIFDVIPTKTTDPDSFLTAGLEAGLAVLRKGRAGGARNNVPQVIILCAAEYNIGPHPGKSLVGLSDVASLGMMFHGYEQQMVANISKALCIVNAHCEDGWTQITNLAPNSTQRYGECIYGNPIHLTRPEAASNYARMGAHLVSEFDSIKQDAVANYANAFIAYYWNGLQWTGSVYQWDEDNTTLTGGSYTNWWTAGGEPVSQTVKTCVYETDGDWSTCLTSCTTAWVCQKKTCDVQNYC